MTPLPHLEHLAGRITSRVSHPLKRTLSHSQWCGGAAPHQRVLLPSAAWRTSWSSETENTNQIIVLEEFKCRINNRFTWCSSRLLCLHPQENWSWAPCQQKKLPVSLFVLDSWGNDRDHFHRPASCSCDPETVTESLSLYLTPKMI